MEHFGKQIKVHHTANGIESLVEGEVFAIDEKNELVVIRRPKAHTFQKSDYFALPFTSIESVEVCF